MDLHVRPPAPMKRRVSLQTWVTNAGTPYERVWVDDPKWTSEQFAKANASQVEAIELGGVAYTGKDARRVMRNAKTLLKRGEASELERAPTVLGKRARGTEELRQAVRTDSLLTLENVAIGVAIAGGAYLLASWLKSRKETTTMARLRSVPMPPPTPGPQLVPPGYSEIPSWAVT